MNRRFESSLNRLRETIISFVSFLQMLLKSGLPRVVLFLLIALVVGGSLILWAEGENGSYGNFFDAIWWGLVSMTTVGYGDIVPQTTLGRIIGMGIILSGVVLISFFTATVSSLFIATKIRESKGLEQINYTNHIVVCGYGVLTSRLFDALLTIERTQKLRVVLVADIPGSEVEELLIRYRSLDLRFVRGDFTHEVVLKRAGINSASVICILPDASANTPAQMDERTTMATLTSRALNPKARLLVHIMRSEDRFFLKRAQADEILVSDEFAGYLMASHAIASGIPQAINELLTPEGDNSLTVAKIPSEFIGKSFGEYSRHCFNQSTILIGLSNEETALETSDLLTADSSALDEFIRRKFQEAGIGKDQRMTRTRINPRRETILEPNDMALIIVRRQLEKHN